MPLLSQHQTISFLPQIKDFFSTGLVISSARTGAGNYTGILIEAKNLDKGRASAEEKLKNIMIKDLMANDNAMVSSKTAEKVDFQGLGVSKESLKTTSKMA